MAQSERTIEIRICQGTACFVFGAAELLAAAEELPPDWKRRCQIVPVPCLGFCNEPHRDERMPYVTIDGVRHHDVNAENLLRLVAEALGE